MHRYITRTVATVALMAPLGVVLVACEDQASPSTIPDGVTTITRNMRGIWNADGGRGCVWSVRVKSGSRWVVVNHGGGNKSQTVIFGSSVVDGQFRSDKCAPKGGWHR